MRSDAFDAMAKPDSDSPQCSKNGAEEIHDGHNGTSHDNKDLQQAPPGQGQRQPPACQHREDHGGGDGCAARGARGARRRVVDLDGHRDREPDHDGFHDQYCRAQALHPPPPSKAMAAPAVITEPVTRIVPAAGASPTAISIASSSLAATLIRCSPNTAPARSASFAGSIDRDEELRVTTS